MSFHELLTCSFGACKTNDRRTGLRTMFLMHVSWSFQNEGDFTVHIPEICFAER